MQRGVGKASQGFSMIFTFLNCILGLLQGSFLQQRLGTARSPWSLAALLLVLLCVLEMKVFRGQNHTSFSLSLQTLKISVLEGTSICKLLTQSISEEFAVFCTSDAVLCKTRRCKPGVQRCCCSWLQGWGCRLLTCPTAHPTGGGRL